MTHEGAFYVDGSWTGPVEPRLEGVINPATEETFAQVAMGSAADVDKAVEAARRAFGGFSRTGRNERLDLLGRIHAAYLKRADDMARLLPAEIGATPGLARAQVAAGAAHIAKTMEVLREYEFREPLDGAQVLRAPVGVCALISPWNNPVSQVVTKAIPAIAAGCTTVSKPSELAPLAVGVLAEVMDEAGVPPGVFNLLHGEGAVVGAALAAHPGVDMVSITGSVAAGVAVAKAAADTVKRVQQELGGKGPNIILADADLEAAVRGGVASCFFFAGQTCGAPSRMIVPEALLDQVVAIARDAAERTRVGPPEQAGADFGPLISRAQWIRVQGLIETARAEGAELVAGGPGVPDGLDRGYYCRPTVFARVDPAMTIAREEVFGPVLSILTYRDEDEAVEIANDSAYGLVGYVQGRDIDRAAEVAGRIRCGYVSVNYPPLNISVPHGGFRRSGNGRQWGVHGLAEYLEMTSIVLPAGAQP